MNQVVYVESDIDEAYEKEGFYSRLSDRFKIRYNGENIIKDLGMSIKRYNIPPNFNLNSYRSNMDLIIKKSKYLHGSSTLAPKTLRKYDYAYYNNFQKNFLGYSVSKSIQLMLRIKNKSIRNSCILIYDAADQMNEYVIYELAKRSRYLIFLSENMYKINRLREYIIANYGMSPMVTNDFEYSIKCADFIVTSGDISIDADCPIWYLDNSLKAVENKDNFINHIEYVTPWSENQNMDMELLGAVLSRIGDKDIDKSLNSNGIFIDEIKFRR